MLTTRATLYDPWYTWSFPLSMIVMQKHHNRSMMVVIFGWVLSLWLPSRSGCVIVLLASPKIQGPLFVGEICLSFVCKHILYSWFGMEAMVATAAAFLRHQYNPTYPYCWVSPSARSQGPKTYSI